MKVILFGNRGSRPLGASENSPWQRYGGDTTSVGVICGKQLVALDTGSGFYKWQFTLEKLLNMKPPYNMSVFYSHYHDDHTRGLPQAQQLFVPNNQIDLYGPPQQEDGNGLSLRAVFRGMANEPSNPQLTAAYNAGLSCTELGHSRNLMSVNLREGVRVSWLPVQHGAITAYGYRIEHDGQVLCMISDTHHDVDADGNPILNGDIVEFIRGADSLIYDSHFTDNFFTKNTKMCQTFGHSTGEQGIRLAEAASVPIFVAHHYDPNKQDNVLDSEIAALRNYGERRGVAVVAAKPSICIDLSLKPEERAPFIEKQQNPADRYQAIVGPGPAV